MRRDIEVNREKVKQIQKIVLEMLCYVDDFCRENNITYFLSGGSVLGAARHQGFIPWDDDADIMLPRPEYERFLKLFAEADTGKYEIASMSTDDSWQIKQGKIWDTTTRLKYQNIQVDDIGVFIDVFPIDGLPSFAPLRKVHFAYTKVLSALGSSCVKKNFAEEEKYRLIKRMVQLVTGRMKPRFFFEIMDKSARKYDFYKSDYAGAIMAAHYGERETMDRRLMESAEYLEFEGRKFPVPAGYRKYLSNLYGDYMTVPEGMEEKGYTHLANWELVINASEKDNTDVKEKVKKMQKIIYRMLCYVDDFCRENDITYYLSGGSCLGAVRHGGFIPWDDDADIMMPRPDYERFVKLFKKKSSKRYDIGSLSVDRDWQMQYARIWDRNTKWKSKNFDFEGMGVFIDLFPIDGVPKEKAARKAFYTKLKVLCELGKEANRVEFRPENHFRTLRRIAGFFVKPLGMRFFSTKINKLAKKYDFNTSELVACSMPVHYGERETISRECMDHAEYLQFEDRKLPVPAGYRTYLSNLYGDYMQIPKDAEENGYSHLEHWDIEI